MATQLAASPAAAATAPFMLTSVVDPDFKAALGAAAVAESASHDVRRNTRCRVSYFLCELANQLNQRGDFNFASAMPLTRYDLSDQLDISLSKVKRVLALLSLSGVVSSDGRTLQVLDWQRLCSVAQVDPARLSIECAEEDDEFIQVAEIPPIAASTTAGGEPACFV